MATGGQRAFSAVCYLQAPIAGGCTAFPTLGLSFPPVVGDAVIWRNLNKDGRPDETTLHAGPPAAPRRTDAQHGTCQATHNMTSPPFMRAPRRLPAAPAGPSQCVARRAPFRRWWSVLARDRTARETHQRATPACVHSVAVAPQATSAGVTRAWSEVPMWLQGSRYSLVRSGWQRSGFARGPAIRHRDCGGARAPHATGAALRRCRRQPAAVPLPAELAEPGSLPLGPPGRT
jgi:hypothetical protein